MVKTLDKKTLKELKARDFGSDNDYTVVYQINGKNLFAFFAEGDYGKAVDDFTTQAFNASQHLSSLSTVSSKIVLYLINNYDNYKVNRKLVLQAN